MANEEQKNEGLKRILEKRKAIEREIGKLKNPKLQKAMQSRLVDAKTDEAVELLYRQMIGEN